MPKEQRQIAEQNDRERARCSPEFVRSPHPDDHQRRHEKRDDPEPRKRQQPVVGPAGRAIKQAPSLDPHVAAIVRAVAGEVGAEPHSDPRQWGMHRFIGEFVPVQELHPGGDMRGLVEGDPEYVVGRDDPPGTGDHS